LTLENYTEELIKDKRKLYRRPWWVCCYANNAAHRREVTDKFSGLVDKRLNWTCPPTPWVDGKRHLRLIDVKTFPSPEEAMKSSSYALSYAPFSAKDVIVVMMRESAVKNYIVQWSIFERDSPVA